MPKVSVPTAKLPPGIDSSETIGDRIARYRKKKGITQKQLADELGINRTLVTENEIGRARIYDEMIARRAGALGTSTDVLLGLDTTESNQKTESLRITRRIQQIQKLSPADQKILLRTIDNYLKGALPHPTNEGGAA